ncbi:ABC transporter substrate-binding protein [Zhihengliuella sp.]|uniref:ABC transporter substrate-binding protein n=1 Tax=Zhihengliuella sp. TaxID=1954483 RepID=UPI00281268FF|nr:ABC transporter substrate-binding protein [Zhihengliuella sp.]
MSESRRYSPAAPAGTPRSGRRARIAVAVAVPLLVAAAVASLFVPAPWTAGPASGAAAAPADTLRLGYFPTVTHAPALAGVEHGFLADELGRDGTALQTQVFTAGPAAVEALNAGAIDAAYLGPSPALASYVTSGGESLVVVAGAASGGAALVAREGIDSVEDLAGGQIATPQYANTQDLAARALLAERGLTEQVDISHATSGTVAQLFERGQIDAAWQPEPWASLLEARGGHVLVDERVLWPDGRFPTALLVVSQRFAAEHPQTVQRLADGHARSLDWLAGAAEDDVVNTVVDGSIRAGGDSLDPNVIRGALGRLEFTGDPLAETYPQLVDAAAALGTAPGWDDVALDGLVDDRWWRETAAAGEERTS